MPTLIFLNYIFSIKPRIFNILIDSSTLNTFSSSFLHLLQIIEGTNVFSKMYDILGFSNFLYLSASRGQITTNNAKNYATNT